MKAWCTSGETGCSDPMLMNGQPEIIHFWATGGSGTYSYQLQGSVPPFMIPDWPDHEITVEPTDCSQDPGTYIVSLVVSDSAGDTGTLNFTLNVAPGSLCPTLSAPTRIARIRARWRSAGGLVVILVAAGMIFPVCIHKLMVAFSPDLALYEHYANAALASPLFHSLPREYPAPATALFLAPLALPLGYALGFALAGRRRRRRSRALYRRPRRIPRLVTSRVHLPGCRVGSGSVCPLRRCSCASRALAVEAARREQWGRAWAWAVVGGLLKLFPFLLLPGFLIAERVQTGKWPLKRLWIVGVPAALLTASQVAVAPGSLLNSFSYQFHRGFELSSLQGSIAFLTDPLHARWVAGFGSVELAGR